MRILILLLAASLGVPAAASEAADWQSRALAAGLAQAPEWRQLLHVTPGSDVSEVNSADFFLAPQGQQSPAAELAAAIEGWFQPVSTPADQHPRCRFPARYEWLRERLRLPDAPAVHCAQYQAWARPEQLRSISLLMVSGFLGNPASSFGHSLLKFNHQNDDAGGRLLDRSFNFGAYVPDQEPMPLYIVRGLFGGYQSGFSSGAYYAHDQVYARTEFRDIWEYRLALTPEETQRMAAHLWELTGRDFTYYFLTKNCAYRLAELLTVVTRQPYEPLARVWFTPVELFHKLPAETGRTEPLAIEPQFFPSSQRQLYWQFQQLNRDETRLANGLIRDGLDPAPERLSMLAPERRLEIVDALIAYYEYRLAAMVDAEAEAGLRLAKTRALRLRLSLPPRAGDLPTTPALPDPTRGSKPMLTAAGLSYREGEVATGLRYAPYFQDLIGRHSGGFTELVVLDTQLRLNRRRPELDSLDLVRVRKLADVPDIAGESQLSWHARAGLGRETPVAGPDEDNPLRLQASAGGGRARQLGSQWMAYALAEATVMDGGPVLRAGPALGLVMRGERFSSRVQAATALDASEGRWSEHYLLEGRLGLARNLELRAGWQQWNDNGAANLSLYRYW